MGKSKAEKISKAKALRLSGSFNLGYEEVSDEQFLKSNEFFDPQDLVQVKYEMLRRVRQDSWSISRAADQFGFSRPSFYEAQANLKQSGLLGLIPKMRGPKRGHKLTDEVLEFIENEIKNNNELTERELDQLISGRFKIKVHPRSIGRALVQWKKKRENQL